MRTVRSLLSAALLPALLAGPALAEGIGAESIEAEGTSYPATISGSGTPVVFVHGSFSDKRVWDGLAADVASGHRFIGYTQRGFGTGSWPDKSFSRDLHTRDLEAILKAIGEPAARRAIGPP